ncbi:MAG: helix-turn-helix transcriptional regulator [Clostridia bacterium]|nr:helix-turn-helix transcriptional regulator [Clostridia bacterium]
MMDSGYEIQTQLQINKMYTSFTAYHKNQYTFTGDSHNYWEVMYVISGSVCATSNDRVYDLSEGDIIFHEPYELHKYYTTSPNTKYLVYSHDLKGNLADAFRQKVFSLNNGQKNIVSSLLDYVKKRSAGGNLDHPSGEHETEDDKVEYFTHIIKDPAYGHGLVLYIYQLMLSLAYDGTKATPSNTYDVVLFSRCVKFMQANLSETKTVSDVAKHANISISGLKRIFEKCAGMGVHKYFLMLKLNAATEFLEQGYSVSHVASRLGFSSQAHFSRAYKRELKVSPSEFKHKKQGTSL